jgi:hypothetical protein
VRCSIRGYRQVLVGSSTVLASGLGSVGKSARSLLVRVAVRCQRRGRLVGVTARGLSVWGGSTVPATGSGSVGKSARSLSVRVACISARGLVNRLG